MVNKKSVYTGLLALVFVVFLLVSSLTYLPTDRQLFVAIGGVVLFFIVRRHHERWSRCFLMFLSIFVSTRYLVWRFTSTLDFSGVLQTIMVLVLALGEIYTTIRVGLTYFQLAWPLRRTVHPLPDDTSRWPVIDVYVPTYNEDLSIVRTTVLGCLALDWPADRLNVYILDDGRRAAFRDFAHQSGAGYITRMHNNHAKAGNLNHALEITTGDLIAIFDCDHVPVRSFLKKTIGWMVADPNLALLQTPHHFYSPDPFQRNMSRGRGIPPETNLFYGLLQDGNDYWNATFFCGSCAVLRRKAIMSINGFATETVTEDAHTALRMQRQGWGSAYLREPMAAGLETETLGMQIGQRMRWARGMFQMLRIDNPLTGPGLKLTQRICYFAAATHYLFSVSRLLFLLAPLGYLFLGVTMIAASPYELAVYALPHLFHTTMTMSRLQGRWRYSFWSELYETVLAPFLVRMTFITLIAPHKGKFNVTDKGGLLEHGYFDWRAVYPNIIIAMALVTGLGMGVWSACVHYHETLVFRAMAMNSLWILFSLTIVMGSIAVARETRQRRTCHRVQAKLPVHLATDDHQQFACHTRDVSMGGCCVSLHAADRFPVGHGVTVSWTLAGGPAAVRAVVIARTDSTVRLKWAIDGLAQEEQVVELVFGRDDAWAQWSDFPPDNPVRSFYTVLLSILALFRPSPRDGETKQAPETGPVVTDMEKEAVLPKERLVIQPTRRPRGAAAGIMALCLMLATGMTAWAQVPAAPAAVPTGAGTPVADRDGDNAVAVFDDEHMTQADAAHVSRTPVTVSRTFTQLGQFQPMLLRAMAPIYGMDADVGRDKIIRSARLSLSGSVSLSPTTGQAAIAVMLNDQPVGVVCTQGNGRFGPVDLPVSALLFDTRNRFNFRLIARQGAGATFPSGACGPDAQPPADGGMPMKATGLQVAIDPDSTLSFTTVQLVPHRLLSALPYPLVDRGMAGTAPVTFVLAPAASTRVQAAGGMVASWLGMKLHDRRIHFAVAPALSGPGNAIVVGVGLPGPWGNAPAGPVVAEIPNPHDVFGTVLVVSGRTDTDVATAARALVLGAPQLQIDGTHAAAPDVTPPARRPYDAPGLLPTDHPVRLGDLLPDTQLHRAGLDPMVVDIPFAVPPDLHTWRSKPFIARLRVMAPPGALVDRQHSEVDVMLNGMFLHSYPLVSWSFNPFGRHDGLVEHDVELPSWVLKEQNVLSVYFDVRARTSGGQGPAVSEVGLDPSSTIDLSASRHLAVLPSVKLFAMSGFPFSRMADMSQTTVLLPPDPAPATQGAFLDLMGFLGAVDQYPVTGLHVDTTDMHAGGEQAGDMLVISPFDRLGAASQALARAGYRTGGTWSVKAGQWMRHLVGMEAGNPPGSLDEGALIAAQSPFAPHHSVVALLGATPDALSAMAGDLRDPARGERFQGDMVVRHGARLDNYRTASAYTEGYMPAWMWPDWYLGGHPFLLYLLGVIGSVAGTSCAMSVLRARSRKRVLNDDLTGNL
ncbi:cellulose synthase catalytic subunit AB [Komagataeibacter intermedius TF2]|uniref:Cellulose synthase catalytic subunit [UDP-forming] n=2 Tax=Komagataeibacter intermedius TaxID=66229 RepID=A0A0N1FFA8_9PROT|nr:cellulose synthase [Komagataeibacter intermedius AF2]GAN87422.1 cellulose synthase catalytic subunit AB [Komagataeibacter intermedius TF2]